MKESKGLLDFLRKEEKSINRVIVPYEKNPMTYTTRQRLTIIGVSMAIISLYTKYINFGHWLSIGFAMNSYPPESALYWMIGSILGFSYGYYKKDKVLEGLGLLSIGYSIIFTLGIINTYYWEWCWWTT